MYFFIGFLFLAVLAQLVEHRYRKPAVTGSTPAHGIIRIKAFILEVRTLEYQRSYFFVCSEIEISESVLHKFCTTKKVFTINEHFF